MRLPEHPILRHRAMLTFVTLGLLALGLLSSFNVAWARPQSAPDCQTVPTAPPTRVTLPPMAPTAEPGGAALQAEKRSSVAHVLPGNTFTYTITVHNGGDTDAGPVGVRDALPATLEVLDVRANLGQIAQDGQVVTVALDGLPAGVGMTLEIDVRVKADTPTGAIIENQFDLEHAGSRWTSPVVAVALPPAQLPVTGGV
jgi:uncharacterized repeat protein (TIGR01451 family)